MPPAPRKPAASGDPAALEPRPLSALLSQVLVAFTLEFDNEFERRMAEAGHPGSPLSLVVWANLVRFLASGPVSVHDLASRSLAPENSVKGELGCLERWRFLTLESDPTDNRPIPTRAHTRAGRILRDGWGSGRGIRSGWVARLTARGLAASRVWTPLFGDIEQRWQTRFGAEEIASLRRALEQIRAQIDLDLPYGLPGGWESGFKYPARDAAASAEPLPLPVLLSQVLLAFTLEFDRESRTPLILCANTLRVLGEKPLPEADIPRLTGASPETSGIGWQIKPYIVVEPAATRGKLVRLSPRGLQARQTYRDLTREIETRWEARFGKPEVHGLRDCLRELFVPRVGGRPLLAEGLVPAPGTIRAGGQTPALGRRDVGAAALQRMRDEVAQTENFLRDPAATLPHYPLWDMNRGFGP